MIERLIASPMPMPLSLCREEGVEELIETLRVEPDARILHRHQHAVRFVPLRADLQLPRPLGDCLHGFDAVDHQIQITCCNWIRSPRTSGSVGREFRV